MGVISSLAVLRAHVLVVGVAGRPLLRLRAEAAVRRRGWVLATSPADADVLLVAGDASGELQEAVLRTWRQVPSPRARRTVRTADELPAALDSAARVLADDALQRAAPTTEEPGPDPSLPLASGSDADRDGLELDVLHVPLGPVLPDWPAGLVADCVLSGDVVLAATVRILPGPPGAEEDPLPAQARDLVTGLDRAARLLRLAGAARPAGRLVRIADRVLAGADPAPQRRAIRAAGGALHRSALLRWTLGATSHRDLVALLTDCEGWARGIGSDPAPIDAAALGARLVGLDLGDARLVVAAAGADPVSREVRA